MSDVIQLYGGAKAGLPQLAEREPGFCTDTGELYIGTGAGNRLINPRAQAAAPLAAGATPEQMVAAYNALVASLKASGLMKE